MAPGAPACTCAQAAHGPEGAALLQAQKLARLGQFRWSATEQRLLGCTGQYCSILGITGPAGREDAPGFEPCLHPADRERVSRACRRAEREGRELQTEFRILRPDGGLRHVRLLLEPEPQAGGAADVWLGTMQDITEGKAAEEFHSGEERFRNLIEGSIQGIVILDEGGKALFANQAFADIAGFASPDELMKLDSLDCYVPPEERAQVVARRRARLNGEALPESFEARRIRHDGKVVWVDYRAKLIDWNGTPAIQMVVVDITQRKRAEQALKSSEASLAQAQALAGLGHYRWSAVEQRPLAHTDSYLQILGLTDAPVSLQQGGVASVLHPQDRERVIKEWRKAEAEGRGFRVEFRILRPDGQLRYLRDMSEPEPNPAGPPQIWFGTLQDITDFVERELELKQNQAALLRAEKLAKSAHFQWCASEGRMMAASEGYYDLLGVTDRTATPGAYPIEARLHPGDRASVVARYRKAEAEGLPLDHEFRILRPDGSIRYMREFAEPEFEPNGKIHCYYGTLQDITELAQERQTLSRSEQKFRNLVEGSIQGIFIHDENGRPLFANQAFAAIYGFDTPAQVLALETLDHLIPGEDLEQVLSYRRARLRGEPAPASYETRRLKRDGSAIWLENRSRLVDWDGKPAIQAVIVDITERKRAEVALLDSEAALSQAHSLTRLGHYRWSGTEQRLLSHTSSYLEILGLSQEPPVGTQGGVALVLHPEDREKILAEYQAAESHGRGDQLEYRILRPDGQVRYIRDLSQPEPNPGGRAETWFGTIQDITDIKRAEEVLRRNEERYRNLTEITSDWEWETDENFRVRSYSANYDPSALGGAAAVIGRTLWQIAGTERPEDDETWAELARLVRAHQPIREFRYALKDGKGRSLHRRLNGRPLFARDGRFTGYLLACRDVTAEVEASARARSAEELLVHAFSSISDGFALYDANDRLTYHNNRYKTLFLDSGWDAHGKTFEELVRLDIADGLYPDAVGREEEFLRERVSAHRRSGVPFLYRTSTGLWIQARDNRLPDGSIVAVRTDVTSLVEAEERFRSLADNLPGIVYRRIVEPSGRMREIYVSAGVEKLLGVRPEEFTSGKTTLLDYVHAEDRDKELALIKESVERMVPLAVESERYIAHGGTVRWWQIRATPRRLGDGGTELDGVALDITEQHAAETQLRKTQRLDALGQLTSGISHDFNNLLGVIIGSLDLALDKAAGNHELEELMRTASDSALRGADLTKGLLAFSRGQPLSAAPVDLNELLPKLGKLLRRTMDERVAVELRLGDGLWPCFIDPSQIDDIILNLAINARDAMPEGGKLTIETRNARLDKDSAERAAGLEPGDYILLSISDTGQGMPREVLDHAFEPFFTTKGPGKGTGLGLSQVYGFVKQSKGHVAIDSDVGRGTTVRIYLPRTQSQPRPDGEEHALELASPRQEVILVAEDNERLRAVAVQEIQQLGYQALDAASGVAALALLDAHPKIELLFSDVVMPGGMTGYDLAREARLRRPDLKVLLTSGFTGSTPNPPKSQIGDIEFLSKPYGKRDLAEKLKRMLEG